MGTAVFGFVLFIVLLPLSWVLEKMGIMEVPAPSVPEVTGSRTSRSEVPAPSVPLESRGAKTAPEVTGSAPSGSTGARGAR